MQTRSTGRKFSPPRRSNNRPMKAQMICFSCFSDLQKHTLADEVAGQTKRCPKCGEMMNRAAAVSGISPEILHFGH
jgi:predicted RNA-binding Zn-ribbon protein involved in translation (DUF1610 family)